jgi:ubiquinone/menaquinone biosynthesis C-methylase UbiE
MNWLKELKRNWEGLAQSDPLWAICTDPARKGGQWEREEFFATGQHEIRCVLKCLDHLGVNIDSGAPALDFGCGVGRLTRAMAARFPQCWGVDISPTMIRLAEVLNSDQPGCRFVLNDQPELKGLADGYFGFIYSSIVLQHIPPRYSTGYLLELVRVLKPGGVLVFQLLDEFRASWVARWRQRLALRQRLRKLAPVSNGNCAMQLHFINEAGVRRLLRSAHVKLVDVRPTNSADPAFNGNLQYLASVPARGFISKQYVVFKER